ncbi:hypothetical protein NEOLEDRAFT_1176863 [Neolentinus lepideus HHB14362 ss-1]|uniref:Thioesterase family protein n=1 Tax=Neolentinus lepideus HHB14362 ss-1 TaxID=1314782 RepID=A0A165U0G5_9AGAM|nr:hypothetical protein NEOLEDRAFT_1176863 [Neolentinus lepideus HHB14362 ss-1]
MAPLSKAIALRSVSSSDEVTSVYAGIVDPDWNVASIPNGGYVLALVVEASIRHQASTPLRDPIHVTAHFLRTTAVAEFEIHVRTLRTGKGFTNLVADFKQQNEVKLTTHFIFGVLSPTSPLTEPLPTLAPPSRYARRIPLLTHPSRLTNTGWSRRPLGYMTHIALVEDPMVQEHNQLPSIDDSNGKELEWAAWIELTVQSERITTPSLAFLVDTFNNLPELLAQRNYGNIKAGSQWFPTLTLTIEFKFPIPTSDEYAKRTVGIHARGRYINNPQGRHETTVEVWSAPSNIGEGQGQPADVWRDKQVCLAVSSQMALVVPMAVNRRKGECAAGGPKL